MTWDGTPRRRNLELLRGLPFQATFEFWGDDAESVPFDLTGQAIKMVVGSQTLLIGASGSGLYLTTTDDPTSGQPVPNIVNAFIAETETPTHHRPSEHWYLEIDPLGVPFNGTCYVKDP